MHDHKEHTCLPGAAFFRDAGGSLKGLRADMPGRGIGKKGTERRDVQGNLRACAGKGAPRGEIPRRSGSGHPFRSTGLVPEAGHGPAGHKPQGKKETFLRLLIPLFLLAAYPFSEWRTGGLAGDLLYWTAHANVFHLAANLLSAWLLVRRPAHLALFLPGCLLPALLWPVPSPACGCSAGLYALAAFRAASCRKAAPLGMILLSLGITALMPHMANTLHLGGTAVGMFAYYIRTEYESRISRHKGGTDL